MTYRVTFTTKARLEFFEAALWWAENRDEAQAARWLEGFQGAIDSLADNPQRHAVARENDLFPFTLRQLLYGLSSKPTHRALFRVREDDVVIIYGIRHVRQRDFTPGDAGLPDRTE